MIVALGDISETIMGQAPPGKECNKEGNGTVFVKAGEFGTRHPVIREWTTKPLKHAKSGDVLICVVGATAGKINLGIDCAIGRSVAAIRPKIDSLDVNYLHYFMRQEALKMRKKSQGLAQGVITKRMLADLPIPLPPLAEQKRIAGILDQADALRRQRQRALDQLNQLGQSIFYEMFGSPVSALNTLPSVSFSEALNDVTRTVTKVSKEKYEATGVLPIIDQGKKDIAGWCELTTNMKVSPAGRIVFGDHTRKVDLISQRFVAGADGVKVLDSREGFEKRFLADLLRFMPIDDLGYSRHMKVLKSARYIKPDKNKQVEYVGKMKDIERANEPMRRHLEFMDLFFSSLQQRAFRGEL